jgi:hypothetical protein
MKGTTLSKDYSSLQNELAGDLSAAATAVSLAGGAGTKKVKLVKSDLTALIPDGCVLEVQAVNFTKLQMGDIICVSAGRETSVRRFVKLKMTKADTYILTAYDGFDKKEALPKSCLIGKVVSVQAQGQTYDPRKKEGAFSAFWGKLTEYGTHKAFGLFG